MLDRSIPAARCLLRARHLQVSSRCPRRGMYQTESEPRIYRDNCCNLEDDGPAPGATIAVLLQSTESVRPSNIKRRRARPICAKSTLKEAKECALKSPSKSANLCLSYDPTMGTAAWHSLSMHRRFASALPKNNHNFPVTGWSAS